MHRFLKVPSQVLVLNNSLIGCLVRIAIGMNKEKKEQVYRIAVVLGI